MDYLNNIKELVESDIDNIEVQGGESRAKYGNGLIKEWSKELTKIYGRGYDYTNLSRMRKLYLVFQKGRPLAHQFKKLSTACQQLS